MYAVYCGNHKLTKEPMTQYEAEMKLLVWKDWFANLTYREIERPAPPKIKRKRRRRMCWEG